MWLLHMILFFFPIRKRVFCFIKDLKVNQFFKVFEKAETSYTGPPWLGAEIQSTALPSPLRTVI